MVKCKAIGIRHKAQVKKGGKVFNAEFAEDAEFGKKNYWVKAKNKRQMITAELPE